MKKNLLTFMVAIFVFAVVSQPAQAKTSVTVGASSWLVNWKMYDGTKPESFLMAGPVISVGLSDKVSLSTVVLFGGTETDAGFGSLSDISRFDSDTAINIKLSKNFKFFAGIKFMRYSMDTPMGEMAFTGLGPAAGLTVTLPLGNNFFFLGSASLLYNASKCSAPAGFDVVEWTHFLGQNSSAALAYYIAPLNVAISLGYRYQCFTSTDEFGDFDHFHGLTLAAVYSFRL